MNKWVGCGLILLAVPILLFARWVYVPLTAGLRGIAFPVFGSQGAAIYLSFGVLSVILLLIAGIGAALRKPLFELVSGIGLLLLTFCSYLRIAVGNGGLLVKLTREADWLQACQLINGFLTPGAGAGPLSPVEPSLWPQLSLNTVTDRLVAGWYFLGLGWYLALAIALAIFIEAACRVQPGTRGRGAKLLAAGLMSLAFVYLYKPVAAERSLRAGMAKAAHGEPESALIAYRRAIRLDEWYSLNLAVYQRIGALDASVGRNTPESRIYRAETLVAETQTPGAIGLLPEAITTYDQLAENGGSLGPLARIRAAELWTYYGLQLYRDGAFGSAVGAWQNALARDPRMWHAAYYLSVGYTSVGRYREAAAVANQFRRAATDPRMVADLFSNIGDAETRSGELVDGQNAYYNSYKVNTYHNHRGLSALVGP